MMNIDCVPLILFIFMHTYKIRDTVLEIKAIEQKVGDTYLAFSGEGRDKRKRGVPKRLPSLVGTGEDIPAQTSTLLL